jgi:two-component system cell cycle sensor histidine kinase/response regulator CckA
MTAGAEVLVADDSAEVRRAVSRCLTARGLTVREAAGGQEAVELYREHRRSIGVVLLDARMPEVDGPAALALLRQIDPTVRCCFLTAGDSRYTAGDLLALGAVHVLYKPVLNFVELAQLLRRLMAEE